MPKAIKIQNKIWTPDTIKLEIQTNTKALYRVLIRIYNNQTNHEQKVGGTTEDNGIGFNGIDGEILSSFAKQYLVKKRLSDKQLEIARKALPKYAGQVFKWMLSQYSDNIIKI